MPLETGRIFLALARISTNPESDTPIGDGSKILTAGTRFKLNLFNDKTSHGMTKKLGQFKRVVILPIKSFSYTVKWSWRRLHN